MQSGALQSGPASTLFIAMIKHFVVGKVMPCMCPPSDTLL